MKTYDEMVALFERANTQLLQQDRALFSSQVSERTLCGALMLHLKNCVSEDEDLAG